MTKGEVAGYHSSNISPATTAHSSGVLVNRHWVAGAETSAWPQHSHPAPCAQYVCSICTGGHTRETERCRILPPSLIPRDAKGPFPSSWLSGMAMTATCISDIVSSPAHPVQKSRTAIWMTQSFQVEEGKIRIKCFLTWYLIHEMAYLSETNI